MTMHRRPLGRGRTLDMIPSGVRSRALGPSEAEALGAETRRAARRYDYTIVSAPLAVARRALPAVDVVLCAALARTKVSTLARSAAGLRDDGARILGVALWEGSLPSPPTARSIDRSRREVEPLIVVEIAFDVIVRSNRHKSGFSLRFPRIANLRPDKSPAEIERIRATLLEEPRCSLWRQSMKFFRSISFRHG